MTADVESASVSAMEPNWPRAAADIGRGFGYLSIALGVAMFIVEGSFSGAWLAFTRWFLLQAATAEARYVATDQALAGLKVGKLMARDPVTVDPDLTVGRFMDEIAWSRRSSPRANPGRTR